MTVAEYIFKALADKGVQHCFLVTGGGAMWLNGAIRKETRITPICCHHEQACAIAAEGYYRASKKIPVVSVTTGPGGTNAMTGVLGAWLDSIPMIVISGQVKTSTTISSCPYLNLRQLGDQEYNIIDSVRPMTKYAKMIINKDEIAYELDKAYKISTSGRFGPVWLDIPLDIQNSQYVDNENIKEFNVQSLYNYDRNELLQSKIMVFIDALNKSTRPVVIAGSGIKNSNSEKLLLDFIHKNNIPLLTSISGIDLIKSNNKLFFGRPGILGERSANMIMQNSDCLIVLGTRMGIRQIGYAYETIAREAIKIMVDIDKAELDKLTFKPDIKINADLHDFLSIIDSIKFSVNTNEWLEYCNNVKQHFPIILDEHRNRKDYVSSYVFPEKVANSLVKDTVVITGNGTAYTSTFQSIPINDKIVSMFANQGCASMGYCLPAAVGASISRPECCIALFTGDGSIMMNLQELQTIAGNNLNIKILMYNNDGYLSIKNTHNAFFNSNFIGCNPESGVTMPEFRKVANAFGIRYFRINTNDECDNILKDVFNYDGPAFVEVMTDPFEKLGPKSATKKLDDGTLVSAPLEDLAPFIDRDEFHSLMIVKPLT